MKEEHIPEKRIFFSDIGGIEEIINEIRELIIYPIKFAEIFKTLGVRSPKGILLCGPPGSGKTSLGLAICNEMDRPFKKITGTEIVSGMSGESEVIFYRHKSINRANLGISSPMSRKMPRLSSSLMRLTPSLRRRITRRRKWKNVLCHSC
jgi:AAA+ superfamily predicted ATPase